MSRVSTACFSLAHTGPPCTYYPALDLQRSGPTQTRGPTSALSQGWPNEGSTPQLTLTGAPAARASQPPSLVPCKPAAPPQAHLMRLAPAARCHAREGCGVQQPKRRSLADLGCGRKARAGCVFACASLYVRVCVCMCVCACVCVCMCVCACVCMCMCVCMSAYVSKSAGSAAAQPSGSQQHKGMPQCVSQAVGSSNTSTNQPNWCSLIHPPINTIDVQW